MNYKDINYVTYLSNVKLDMRIMVMKWPTLHTPENRLILRTLSWSATYAVTIQRHITNASA